MNRVLLVLVAVATVCLGPLALQAEVDAAATHPGVVDWGDLDTSGLEPVAGAPAGGGAGTPGVRGLSTAAGVPLCGLHAAAPSYQPPVLMA